MSEIRRLRCAVYTRKSSEEGLDQAFNSLDAQREACVAFIASQASLGWKLVPDPYDDGGISGGTLERPGIQRLLQHIRDGKVDVVVVYKIDRLTRSLMDFAKLVEVFDGHSVSFVSVTQQFNTTTSMGRLTLNVLLSFAQFEREVTAERIRDKVAASKKKGIWMGGVVPFGYRAEARKLVIDEAAAAMVRHIFNRYLDLRSVPALVRELNEEEGRRPADIGSLDSSLSPRSLFGRGRMYHLLANPVYIGKIRHKGELHDGEHDPIVAMDTFQSVQKLLVEQAANPKGSTVHPDIHLLTGRLFDEHGNRLTPVHARNHGKRYRYYVTDTRQAAAKDADCWRIPATTIEPIMAAQLIHILRNRSQLAQWIQEYKPTLSLHRMLHDAAALEARIAAGSDGVLATSIIKAVMARVTLGPDSIRYDLNVRHLLNIISSQARWGEEPAILTIAQDEVERARSEASCDDDPPALVSVTQPITIKRRGVERKIVVGDGIAPNHQLDQTLINMLAKAHLTLQRLTDGSSGATIATVASDLAMDAADLSRILPLAFLSPKLTEAILTGRQPPDVTLRSLTRGADLHVEWAHQDGLLAS